jgi:hypothetical protein
MTLFNIYKSGNTASRDACRATDSASWWDQFKAIFIIGWTPYFEFNGFAVC